MPELQSPVSQSSKSQLPDGLNPRSPASASRVFDNVTPDPRWVPQICLSQLKYSVPVRGIGALPRFGSFRKTGRFRKSKDPERTGCCMVVPPRACKMLILIPDRSMAFDPREKLTRPGLEPMGRASRQRKKKDQNGMTRRTNERTDSQSSRSA